MRDGLVEAALVREVGYDARGQPQPPDSGHGEGPRAHGWGRQGTATRARVRGHGFSYGRPLALSPIGPRIGHQGPRILPRYAAARDWAEIPGPAGPAQLESDCQARNVLVLPLESWSFSFPPWMDPVRVRVSVHVIPATTRWGWRDIPVIPLPWVPRSRNTRR